MTDKDKEIADLEFKRDRAYREYLWCEGQIFRLKQKPITPEEREASLKVCRSIGRKAGVQTWYDESLTGGTKEVV